MRYIILGIQRSILCHMTAATIAVLAVFPLTLMALDRNDPVTIIRQSLSGDLRPLGHVRLEWEALATRYCDGDVRSRIIGSDGVVHYYATRPTVIRPRSGEHRVYSLEFTLPGSLSPGPARREAVVYYWCNPLQRILNWPITVNRETIHFVVES